MPLCTSRAQGLLAVTQGPGGSALPLRSGEISEEPTSGMDTVYLSDESLCSPRKKRSDVPQPRLPTPWTWKRAEDSSAGLCWEHTVSKGQGED